jgi:AAA family ATP:ADP antiporter
VPTAPASPAARRSSIERFLSVFTDVRAGEGAAALAFTLNIFLILTAYYLIKPVREALILSVPNGPELKSYASAGQAFLLLFAVPAYGWLASRVPRMRLIDSVTLFFSACLVAFYLLIMGGASVGIAFFLWVGIFNLMVPAQLWAFANDVYSVEAGRRLFVLIAFGASSGAVLGSLIARQMIRFVGVYEMLLVAAGILMATLVLTHYINRHERPGSHASATATQSEQPVEPGNPFGFVLRNRYLLLIAVMLLLNNWVNSNGEYILGRIVKEAAAAAAALPGGEPQDTFIATFYSGYFGVVNLVGMLLQLFVVSRIVKYVGVPVAVCVLPLITLASYATIVAVPVLAIVRWVKTAENATDYSLQNTVKQMLYLPTTRTEKYKAKQAIDSFFVRAGDVCSSALVLVGTTLLAFGVEQFALVTCALSAVWLVIAWRVGRRLRAMTGTPAPAAGGAPAPA